MVTVSKPGVTNGGELVARWLCILNCLGKHRRRAVTALLLRGAVTVGRGLRRRSRLGVWVRVRMLNVQNGTRVTCFERNNHEHRSRGIGPEVCAAAHSGWEHLAHRCE